MTSICERCGRGLNCMEGARDPKICDRCLVMGNLERDRAEVLRKRLDSIPLEYRGKAIAKTVKAKAGLENLHSVNLYVCGPRNSTTPFRWSVLEDVWISKNDAKVVSVTEWMTVNLASGITKHQMIAELMEYKGYLIIDSDDYAGDDVARSIVYSSLQIRYTKGRYSCLILRAESLEVERSYLDDKMKALISDAGYKSIRLYGKE